MLPFYVVWFIFCCFCFFSQWLLGLLFLPVHKDLLIVFSLDADYFFCFEMLFLFSFDCSFCFANQEV